MTGKSTTRTSNESAVCTEQAREIKNNKTWPALPFWAEIEERCAMGDRLKINEWDGGTDPSIIGDDASDIDQYRRDNGWKVRHSIIQYHGTIQYIYYDRSYQVHYDVSYIMHMFYC